MRRRFTADLCPKAPPPKMKRLGGNMVGSRFNQWFRERLKAAGINNKEFARLSKQPYSTVMMWRYRHDPQVWGQCSIAETLSDLGLGGYDTIRREIEDLVNGRR